jgi:hypothetical protein
VWELHGNGVQCGGTIVMKVLILAVLLMFTVGVDACATPGPHIGMIGVSNTCGIPCDAEWGCSTCFGTPEFLEREVRSVVSNRGLSGWTTTWYLLGPNTAPNAYNGWGFIPELPQPAPDDSLSILQNFLLAGNTTTPKDFDVAIMQIGVNNQFWGTQFPPTHPLYIEADTPEETFAEYQTLIGQIEAEVPTVYVRTEPCGGIETDISRCSTPASELGEPCCVFDNRITFDWMQAYNNLIRVNYPARYIDIDVLLTFAIADEIAASGGTLTLADFVADYEGPGGAWVHYKCRGHMLMAEIIADRLVGDGVVVPRNRIREAQCSEG